MLAVTAAGAGAEGCDILAEDVAQARGTGTGQEVSDDQESREGCQFPGHRLAPTV